MKFISLLATGYSVVDYAYARTKGIPVANVPTYGTASVSQFSIAAAGDLPPHRPPRRLRPLRNLGQLRRLVLLGLPSH